MDLFEFISSQYKKEVEKSLSTCEHKEVEQTNQFQMCSDCGVILCQKFQNEKPNYTFLQQRKRSICTIYEEIPSYIESDIKNLTVELYKLTTNGSIFRNVFRRAVILACLHRASIILNKPIFFDEMLSVFKLKIHDANKGISFVSSNIPDNDYLNYKIPYANDEIGVKSLLISLGIKHYSNYILKLFSIVKTKSDLLNVSHSKSVICGCIWFYLKHNTCNISLKYFALKCLCAETTIQKKFIEITKIVYRLILKSLFSKFLVFTKFYDVKRSPLDISETDLQSFSGKYKLTVLNYANPKLITVTEEDGFVYPLDDVEDILDWNVLFEKTYYDKNGTGKKIGVKFIEGKEIKLDCTKFDEFSENPGKYYLKTELDLLLRD